MDYVGEQEMEMEALEAILMDDMKEVDGSVRDQQAAIPPEACGFTREGRSTGGRGNRPASV